MRIAFLQVLILSTCTLLSVILATAAEEVTVAVVRDGPSREDELSGLIEDELKRIIKTDAQVSFKVDPDFDAQWDPRRFRTVVENALGDREVDIILGIGSMVTLEAAKDDLPLTKPFISTYVQRADIPKLPYDEEGKLKKNFSIAVLPQRAERDIRTFKELVTFERLHVGLGAEEEPIVADLESGLKRYEDSLGVALVLVPVTQDLESTLANIDAQAEAFYLTSAPRLSLDDRQALFAELAKRKIPSFTLLGHGDVELGALAGLTPDIKGQLVRRVALNLSRVIRGESTSRLPTVLSVDTKLLINGKTAAAVGFAPTFETVMFSNFLHEDVLRAESKALSFAQALQDGEKNNTALMITDSDVETSRQDMRRARSVLLPQVFASAVYQKADTPGGAGSALFAEDLTVARVQASQMIFDDQTISDYRSSTHRYDGSQQNREADRLDVLAEVGQAYLTFALSQILMEIEVDNVGLTEDNLELARLRSDVGYSGRDEVFRWEAELAAGRSDLFGSHSNVQASRIDLNQALGTDQAALWDPDRVDSESVEAYFLEGRLTPVLSNVAQLDRFRAFAVAFSLENAPELRFLDSAIEAQAIQLKQRRRRFVLPSVFANFSYDYEIDRSPDLPGAEDATYTFQIAVSYPLFQGGGRFYDVQREKSVLNGLDTQRNLIEELLEQRTRTAIHSIESSFPSVKFNKIRAESARKNLDIVQDKYAQGIVNVTDLLEAQNQSFTAEQAEAAAVYTYLIDIVELQRSLAWFQDEKSEAEKDEFVSRAQAAIKAQ